MKLEIIGFNIESCIIAAEAGANRIELCGNPAEGGTTPSYGFIEAARNTLQIELYVMIRPRGGDFIYSAEEYQIMRHDIEICKQLKCDGVVIGMLTPSGKVDKERCEKLINYAYPLGVTFHRAFDRVKEPVQSLKEIIDIGCERILTSGLKPKAADGKELIRELITEADERIIIMPGSGVNAQNIISLAESTGATEFHSSASILKDCKMEYNNGEMNEQMNHIIVNKTEMLTMRKLLDEYSG
ncbi:MAG: copper homeostasis protein CutC [Bacteroidota bacterium]|nr:copper homeostasis protein CutC [Bacteroidota bacterium]